MGFLWNLWVFWVSAPGMPVRRFLLASAAAGQTLPAGSGAPAGRPRGLHYLIFRQYSITLVRGEMSQKTQESQKCDSSKGRKPPKRMEAQAIKHNSKMLVYPDGSYDLVVSSGPDFGPKGWEDASKTEALPRFRLGYTSPGKLIIRKKQPYKQPKRQRPDAAAEDVERAMRRARANVRRLALANDFRWFVTLTLDEKVVGDRCDPAVVTRKLNTWLSNMVQRHGLRYVLVPELHQKGGIHFHGFFNDLDALRAVDSGHVDKQGHKVWNLARWTLGFSTAIELYGEYSRAVAYVCKYIGKDSQKIGGRWYYSGGALQAPREEYADLDFRDVLATFKDQAFQVEVPGKTLLVVNGVKPETACE